ncbi:hydroxymethylglutaryl-CoA reductase, degradative [Pacificoceanicola onchidii]|uniref:hydroxymethylglutaryl-CoA reductase, degradative n=1 Tax=Pacificoceanicola onchidii TaxID=2562685 RepID=UPI0010A2EFD0|nr:hydroxymethylglutaryl-CoA reductase, degradative [Pacificoceanicola onchidii]
MTSYTSKLSGLRSLTPGERQSEIRNATGTENAFPTLTNQATLPIETADGMIENVIGTFDLPLGVATNFQVNGKDYLIPMAVEEPSVVAAASFMAKLVRENGGFRAKASRPVMRAQIQLLGMDDPHGTRHRLLQAEEEIIKRANETDRVLVDLGGGCIGIEVHIFENTRIGHMVVLHLLVDVRDAMGANAVNTMAETLAPFVSDITGSDVRLRILSNLADRRTVSVYAKLSADSLATTDFEGDRVANGIVEACTLAEIDPYRAATHNKGIMNGIDPVVLATGNDWRAVEAGAHAFAARTGRYTSLTRWERDKDGALIGSIELPMPVGIVGGATRTHPAAKEALDLMRITSASELAEVIAAVGLAQNMAALRALSTEGIQRGHMALHARNIAIAAGAQGADIDRIAKAMAEAGTVSTSAALDLLK